MFRSKIAFYTALVLLLSLAGTGQGHGFVQAAPSTYRPCSGPEKARHSFFPFESGYVAWNPEQAIRVRATEDGTELTDEAVGGTVSMAFAGLGRTRVRVFGKPRISARENRLEAVSGPVTEWFVNRPGIGLEHGVTIRERPEGEGPVRAAWKLGGTMAPSAEPSRGGIVFKSENGAMRFGGLKAWDAYGDSLPVRMALVDSGTLEYVLDDTHAAYPVTIDPVFSQVGKLVVDGGAVSDVFGDAVDVEGDYAAVGAPGTSGYSGSVYIYKRTDDAWNLSQVLTNPGNSARDYFGLSLDLDGFWLLVGAPGADQSTGTAYMFTRNGDSWSLYRELVVAGGARGDYYGAAVALDGKLAVVGAPWRDACRGAVYTFKYASTWHEEGRLTADDTMPDDRFGNAVSLSGNDLAVRTPRFDSDSGKVYLYQHEDSGWRFQKRLQPPFGRADELFGTSLSFNDDMLAVGAPGRIVDGNKTGAVFAFNRTSWELHQEVGGRPGGESDSMGTLAVLSGNSLLMSSPDSDMCGKFAGAALLFALQDDKWTLLQQICAADEAEGDKFGISAAMSGSTMMVGASWKDSTRGATYIFAASPPTTTALTPGNNTTEVPVNTVVSAVFDQAMNASSISTSTFLVKLSADGSPVTGTVSWDAAQSTATFRPSADLLPDTQYTAVLTAEISNAVGMVKGSETGWSFTTASGPGPVDVGIKSVFPESRAEDVSVRTCVTACFNGDMDSSTITKETFKIKGVNGTVRYDTHARKAYFIPDAELAHATAYEAVLTTGVKDIAGNPLSAGQSWAFTTEATYPDSDGDGTPDNQDSFPLDPTKATFPSAVSDSEFTVVLEAESGAVFQDIRSISPQDPSLDMTNYPGKADFASGLVHFEIANLTPGAQVRVTISCTPPPSGTPVAYKAGANGFYSFADHAECNGANCTLALTDGGAGDEDLAKNGRISDPAGVAGATSSAAGTSSGCLTDPSAGFGTGWLLAVLIPLLPRIRRFRR